MVNTMELDLNCISQYKNCVKGIPCGNTCIAKGKNCKPKPNAKANAVADLLANPDNLADGADKSSDQQSDKNNDIKTLDSPPESKEFLGKGVYGEVYLTPNGTAYKSALKEPMNKNEVDIMNEAAKLGVAPKVEGVYKDSDGNIKGVEMEFLSNHTPMDAIPESLSPKAVEAFSEKLAALHTNGIFHGDLHEGNVLIDKNGEAKIIDYGISSKISDDPKEAELKMWLNDVNEATNIFANLNVAEGKYTQLYNNTQDKLYQLTDKSNKIKSKSAKEDFYLNGVKNIYEEFKSEING